MKPWLFAIFCLFETGLGAAAAPSPVPVSASASSQDWNLEAYRKAVKASGREMKLSQSQFKSLQERKKRMLKRIEAYLKRRFGKPDPLVLQAFGTLPREYFQYQYAKKSSFAKDAYESSPIPYAIGYGSALSDYLGQAFMTQLLELKPEHKVLEIGTGSGYQVSALSRIAKEAWSIEIQKPLGKAVSKIFAPLGYSNVHTKTGDGFYGWPEKSGGPAGGFDRIIVTCAASYVPPALFKELKPNGVMVIPIGQPFRHDQVLYVYRKDSLGKVHSKRIAPVYFVPMTGDIDQGRTKHKNKKKKE
jgi:protein-L-isoaspartate(D-aspartate) O-methyltransferase